MNKWSHRLKAISLPNITVRISKHRRVVFGLAILLGLALLVIAKEIGEDRIEKAISSPNSKVTVLEGARISLRPGKVRQGDFFEINVEGSIQGVAADIDGQAIEFFRISKTPNRFAGWVAIPLEHPIGRFPVRVAIADTRRASTIIFDLPVEHRKSKETSIKVAKQFTSPSQRQIAQIRADSTAIRKAYSEPPVPPLFSSNFGDPLANERGSLFGERRVFNGRTQSRHMGLDIDGKQDEPVLAANDGIVVLARPCFASGNTIIIYHGAGIFTGYFHLSSFRTSERKQVAKGSVIGLVGSTGRSTGPHLHFAARLNQMVVDPESLINFEFFD